MGSRNFLFHFYMRHFNYYFTWILLMAVLASCETASKENASGEATVDNMVNRPPAGDTTIIDVRTPDEYASGHIKGAVNIDYLDDAFETHIAKLDPAKSYLLYCHSGHRSSEAKSVMMEKGFKQVNDIKGGILAWKGEIVQE